MNWFEMCLLSNFGDLYLGSDGAFIKVDTLGDGTPFFDLIGILDENIYEYCDVDGIFYDGFDKGIIYKKVNKEDYPNQIFATELEITSDDEFNCIGNKRFYDKVFIYEDDYYIVEEDGKWMLPNELKTNKKYITQYGMIMTIEKNNDNHSLGTFGISGLVGANPEIIEDKKIHDWFGFYLDDLVFTIFDENEWKNKGYKIYWFKEQM